MDAERDIYFKLRPAPPTPVDDLCACAGAPPLKVFYDFRENPIHCLDCNLEVPPERLGLGVELVEALAACQSLIGSLYLLWLDSGEYEEWAYRELVDPSSAANRRGLATRAALDPIRRCYYRYFQDETGDHGPLSDDCPLCGVRMTLYSHGIVPQLLCEQCGIVTVSDED
jgi:hypothetical protein